MRLCEHAFQIRARLGVVLQAVVQRAEIFGELEVELLVYRRIDERLSTPHVFDGLGQVGGICVRVAVDRGQLLQRERHAEFVAGGL